MSVKWLKSHRKEIFFLGALTMILFSMQLLSSANQNQQYIRENHQVVAIFRDDISQNQTIPITVEVMEEGKKEVFHLNLSLDGVKNGKSPDGGLSTSSGETDSIEAEVQLMTRDLQNSEETLLLLPKALEDGTPLLWTSPSNRSDYLLLLILPLGIFYLYRSEIDREKRRKRAYQNEIFRALPAFNDQLLLLMNSGIIFHDAFYRLSANYDQRKEKDSFSQLILNIKKESELAEETLVSALKKSTKEVGVREYSRLVNIIVDNQYKGVDLEEKMESESRLLWEARKSSFVKKGKELDVKLTFPLAILLIVLIIITGAPAMMNMY